METTWINKKHKTCLYAAYKRITSEERAYTDWKVRDGNFFFMQIKMKRRENGVAIFILDKIDFICFSKNIFSLNSSFFFPFIFISWRLITLQDCSGFCHTLTWISHRFTCIPHPDPPSHLPLHLIPLGLPSAPAPSTCLMHPNWAGDLFHPR